MIKEERGKDKHTWITLIEQDPAYELDNALENANESIEDIAKASPVQTDESEKASDILIESLMIAPVPKAFSLLTDIKRLRM